LNYFTLNLYVEALSFNTSECGVFGDRIFEEVINKNVVIGVGSNPL
jgi:hypothetical protein